MKASPFDHRQDCELGDALRSALSGHNEAAFVQSVVAAAVSYQDRGSDGAEWWDVLNAWARPGLAAAAIGLAAAAALRLGTSGEPSATTTMLDDPLQASAEIPSVFLTTQPPDLNEVLALELGN